MLHSVQYLRAMAALAVVLFHFRSLFVSAGGPSSVAGFFDWGHGGVPIFFVVAGFIMVWVTRLSQNPTVFVVSRFVRIYAGYLPIALVFMLYKRCSYGLEHWIPEGLDLWGSITLTGTNPSKLLIYPAWSLPFELFFYVCFAICLSAGARNFLAAGFGLVCCVVAAGGLLPKALTSVVMNPVNINFLLGVGTGVIVLYFGGARSGWRRLCGSSAAAFLAIGIVYSGPASVWLDVLGFGVGTAALLYLLAALELEGQIPPVAWLSALGDASYGIYLLHVPLLYVLQTLEIDAFIAYRLGPYALATFFLVLLCCLSVAYYRVVELPINRIFKRIVGRRRVTSAG
ncbi:acyltransferase family protein [Rhizobium sp. P32RR-XVIII]|uniref:acyltransferase family protein n=1 Tax=Rhizobium sp. P32RR-XVIII TaxID=2726738 RepID=UPI001FEF0E17|nr:acyltransferase [Rhizobium sp. P32RR-XVIII]